MEENEKELETYILNQFSWEKLPPNIKKKLDNSKEAWRENVVKYSVKHQLRWKNSLVRTMVSDERSYYLEIIRISKMNLMLYPYHISDVLIKGLKLTPFKYYLDMMHDVMKNELSYDRVPNWSAIDCVRLLGIGRNEYLDTMNKCRSKGWLWRVKKSNIIKELLPSQPMEIEMDYWWIVQVSQITEDDIKTCDEHERAVIDVLIDGGPREAGELDKSVLQSLHKKGLIYFDVPISSEDILSLPPLEGFVMNRVSGDYFENILYKIFVSLDERTSMEKLAHINDMDVEMVKQAASIYCRLGFAKKKNMEPLVARDELQFAASPVSTTPGQYHQSWYESAKFVSDLKRENDIGMLDGSGAKTTPFPIIKTPATLEYGTPTTNENKPSKRIGFLFDYTLTALLMMGNLAPGLKSHAVTMYEVGKLANETLDDFLNELDKVHMIAEGEAQRYHDHAIALRQTVRFLRNNPKFSIHDADGGVDLLRCERLNQLEPTTRERILNQNYALLISMAPISNETPTVTSCIPRHFGPAIAEMNSVWFKLFLYYSANSGPSTIFYPKGTRVRTLPSVFRDAETVQVYTWQHDPSTVHVSHLLTLLNDHLLDGPVMVQLKSYSEQFEVVNVGFPIESSEEGEPKEYNATNLHRHPAIRLLSKSLNLSYTFGYISMLKLERSKKIEWVPVDLFFGLPLGDVELNLNLVEKIEKYKLFTDENIAKQSKYSRLLCIRLLDFISRFVEGDMDLDTHQVAFPARVVQFSNGKLL